MIYRSFLFLATWLILKTTLYADVFPISTEMQIGRIINIIDRAPKGTLLTVGGERAFREASMFENIEYLVVVDIAPEIIKFNKINSELLKTPSRENYKILRWESDFSEWQKISRQLTQEDFDWWSKNIRSFTGYDVPERLNRYGAWNRYIDIRRKLLLIYPKVSEKFNNNQRQYLKHVQWSDIEFFLKKTKNRLTKEEFDSFDLERKLPNSCVMKFINNPYGAVEWAEVIDYKSGNYLFSDKLYQRLHQLVINNKIQVLKVDLTKSKDINFLVKKIQQLKTTISVVDFNNLFLYDYIGEVKFRAALSQILRLGEDESILILMHNYKQYPCAQFSIYLGFTFENIRSWKKNPFFENFIENLPKDIYPLIDGKLYEKNESLPFYLIEQY